MADKELEQGLEELESVKQTFKSNIGAKGISTYSIEFRNYPNLINQMEKILPSQTKTVNPTTSEQSVSADSGYKLVGVKVNAVKPSDYYKPEEIANVTPTTSDQEINPTNGAVFSKINVSAVTSAIDPNLKPDIIKKGEVVLGLTGTYEGEATGGGGTGSPKFGELVDGSITTVEESDLADVEEIRPSAFENITALQSVAIPSNVTTIGANAFNGCTGVTSLSLAEGVQTIGANAFNGVSATFEIPRSLINVGEGAFANNTAITSLTIPSALTTLSANMFNGCTNLTEITMESTTPPSVTSTTFPDNVSAIYVIYGSYDDYVAQWTDYADKIVRLPAIPSTITVTVNDYNGELVSGASVTITGNEQTYTGTTNESGVFIQGDLQPATYTISVADMDGYRTPESQEVVVEEDTQNNVTITYLEKSAGATPFADAPVDEINTVANDIATKGMTSAEVEGTYGWKLGDTRDITLTTGEKIQMQIIGFNHDDLTSGLGKAGITLQMVNCLKTLYEMKASGSNAGGYEKTTMKTTTLPKIKTTLPSDWQGIIQAVNKKSSNGGAGTYTAINTTSEELFLPSVVEVASNVGYLPNAAGAELEGTLYEYWSGKTDSQHKKKYDTNNDGTPDTLVQWRLRSASKDYTGYFCTVFTNGGIRQTSSLNDKFGVSFAFCIGAPQPSRTFSENSPTMISAISSQISANNMTSSQVAETYGWNIGDTISYDLTTGENVEMRIIGFNHDDKSDGSGKAGITLEMTHELKDTYKMHSSKTSGYQDMNLRNTTLPTIKGTLPQDWQSVIKPVNKSYANKGGASYTETLTSSEELFLLSEIEVFGVVAKAKAGDTEGTIYEYWNGKVSGDRVKLYDSNSDGVVDKAYKWALRSSYVDQYYNMCCVSTSGNASFFSTKDDFIRVSYAFCI